MVVEADLNAREFLTEISALSLQLQREAQRRILSCWIHTNHLRRLAVQTRDQVLKLQRFRAFFSRGMQCGDALEDLAHVWCIGRVWKPLIPVPLRERRESRAQRVHV
ncbi:hypothetical protein [Paraburkholderia caffeinilytica]|uniref:hypothetical protein n=1 Tax=Paraburkholderia caffeinilytica TaxID=1761016 RepID=UPI003DA1342A